jgi:hypothetical protein
MKPFQFYLEATSAWVERGQSSSDLARFNHWREQAVAYTDALPQNDFECLAFAQHYGLATRLLDWSTNPLVALYFAVEMQGETDGAVFCHMPWLIIDRENSSIDREFDRAVLLTPRPFDLESGEIARRKQAPLNILDNPLGRASQKCYAKVRTFFKNYLGLHL